MARPTARYRVTAEDKTKAGLNSVRRNLGSLKGQFAAIGAAAGVIFGAFSKSAFSAADDLNKLNDQLNISTEALSQYRFVAQQTGVEFNTLTSSGSMLRNSTHSSSISNSRSWPTRLTRSRTSRVNSGLLLNCSIRRASGYCGR
jgi:hypothetical protein